MLAIVFLSLVLSEPQIATATGVSQAETFAAAADAHLKLATTSAERPLDEFHNAHTKFDAAFLVDGATVYLCRALGVADLALRTATFTDEQERLSWEETRRDDLDRLRDDAAQTGRANCRYGATGKPRVVLLAADDPPALAADDLAADPPLSTPLAAPPAAVHRVLTVPSRRQVHRARAHTAMGAVFTGAGIGMLGILAGVLQLERQRAGEIRGIIDVAKAEHRGYTPAEERRYFDLRDDLLRGRDAAIGVGVAGLVSLGTGVALLATRKKTRSRTYALQPYGGPQGAGAVLRLRF
ncbi:hypothetical protein [Nannocystis sp.]|uniref:hypothetical protein n=1 Tax=Nannocystis sp. TaxID=1962667 RepID=UPI0025E0C3D9|nr:hypothetical protein [Nannocystis sp.]MBK7829362.1 hypothetical protein [Nannocystis sp.]